MFVRRRALYLGPKLAAQYEARVGGAHLSQGIRRVATMNNKEIPKHYHHFAGGMRDSVDELLVKYEKEIGELRSNVADVFPTDQPGFYDDLFLMRFVMTHSKDGKQCNLKVRA
jgi:hypothetical protein